MPEHKPDVSIVIPVFNRVVYLERAINSCLSQECNVEVLVIDDGSTEDVGSLLTRHFHRYMHLSATFPQVRWFRQTNQGACVARNRGMEMAQGNYMKFLDSDDELKPGSLTQELAAAEHLGCDALLTSWEERTYLADGSEDQSRHRIIPVPRLDHGIDDMLEGKGPWTSAALYRSEFVKSLRWDPAWTKAQDWGWSLTVCLAGARFESLDVVSSIYNHHPGSRITNTGNTVLRSTLARQSMLQMVERMLEEKNNLTSPRRHRLAQYYYRDCQVLARHDPSMWKQVWTHCQELMPGFHPRETNKVLNGMNRLFGVHAGVRIYVGLKSIFLRA